eukprot:bmy_03160T0
MAENDVDNELLDYEDDEVETAAGGDGAEAPAKKDVKGSYVSIHSSGFRDFLLKPELLRAIVDCGFEHPSEERSWLDPWARPTLVSGNLYGWSKDGWLLVQHECIPQAILGMDVLCQAKSGMGKTAVFVLATLQQLEPVTGQVSVLVMCHTRELAFQISKEYERFSKYMPNVKVAVFFGGLSIKKDEEVLKKNCPHIVVGTPGRILALARNKSLNLKHIKHFILDECDKMLEQLDMRRDVQEIFRMTPHEKQVMMFSATLSKEIRPVCRKFMQDVNTLLPSLPPLPARCLLPLRALFLQTPLSFKRQEGGTCPFGSDDSLKRHTEAETVSVRVCAGARETPEDLVGLTRAREGQTDGRALSKRRANSTDESAPSPPPGVGAFGTSIPESILLPTRTSSSHPSGTLVDVSRQQRSTVARRGNADGTRRWMAAAEAAGNLTRKPRTKPASFSVPGFFPEPKACRVPYFPPFVLPMEIFVDDETKLTLHGLQQYYVKLKDNEKNRKLFDLLDVLEFNQVVIFVKSVQRCIALAQLLVEQNFPAIAIHRGMPQEERLSRYQQFKDFQRRILVATNLFGRGMDIERVNIAFNYDMPEDSDTYLHRVARAGRFGTKGLAITFVSDENDAKILNDVQDRFEVNISELPDEIDISSYIEQTR